MRYNGAMRETILAVMVVAGWIGTCWAAESVKVSVDPATGAFDAAWSDVEVEVHGLGFWAEVDGGALGLVPRTLVSRKFKDSFGAGTEWTQRWGESISAQRVVRAYDALPVIVVSAQLTNNSNRPAAVGTVKLIDSAKGGGWRVGKNERTPGTVYVAGDAMVACDPVGALGAKNYGATQFLALAQAARGPTLVVGYLSAQMAGPS